MLSKRLGCALLAAMLLLAGSFTARAQNPITIGFGMALTGGLLPDNSDVPIYFRAPYGQWTPHVAQVMNADFPTCLSYFGPIGWDNSATDWDKWLNGVDPASVANDYLSNVNGSMGGRGIISV